MIEQSLPTEHSTWPLRELILGIAAILIFEGGRWILSKILRWRHRQDALKRLLRLEGEVSVARSIVETGGRSFVRDSDTEVENMLPLHNRMQVQHELALPSLTDPSKHLIVIGSPRFNQTAHTIQRHFRLPYQFVWVTVGDDPATRELSIVTEQGEEFSSFIGHDDPASTEHVDYGILFVARLANDKQLLWIAGIHGAGTIGVAKFLATNAATVGRALSKGTDQGVAWLIRVRFRLRSTGEIAESQPPEFLGTARPVSRSNQPAARALVCDFGNVVMEFDRSRSYRAIGHFLNRDFRAVATAIEESNIRERYERGEIDTDHFIRQLRQILHCTESQLPKRYVEEFWGDIFWERPEMHTALQALRRLGIPLVLLSNTNPLHFEHVSRDYPDLIGLFDDIVLSYVEKAAKPATRIFERAITILRQRDISDLNRVLYVDDDLDFVRAAKELGMLGYTYQSYPQFAFWLRQHGLYVD